MAWTLAHTQAYSTTADNHTFFGYLFDTHIAGKTGWTVSAHPGGQAFKRSLSLSLPSPWANGANVSNYWWVSWTNVTPTGWSWYRDDTYTTVPGDLGTVTARFNTSSTFNSAAGDWRIWESSTDPEAILVTKGKVVIMFWPGATEWYARPDPNWDGTNADNGTTVGPYIGQSEPSLQFWGYPADVATGTTDYRCFPDIGHTTKDFSPISLDSIIVPGLAWVNNTSSSNQIPMSASNPILPRCGADTGFFMPPNVTDMDRALAVVPSNNWSLLLNTADNNYWLLGTIDYTYQCLALNMGPTEPVFT